MYLAPGTARFEMGVGEVLLYACRYREAIAAADKTLLLDSSFTSAHGLRGCVQALQGDVEQARASFSRCTARDCAAVAVAALGYAYASKGDRTAAMRHIDGLTARWRGQEGASDAASSIAGIYAALGERQRALDWLERGLEKNENMLYTGIAPEFVPLHSALRLRALLRKLGLPEPRQSVPS